MVTPVFLQAWLQEVDKQGQIVGAWRVLGNFLRDFARHANQGHGGCGRIIAADYA
jgi:hypothetical protein